MRSLLGRFHRPFARGTEEQLLMLNNLGDGSTLSLDFTTGVLDPRLTFTRDSNATFINSSGLVQWADSNIFYNSTWTDANNTPTAWSVGSGTASRSGETRTFTTSASQVYITQTRNTASGIRYSASVEVTAVTGTQRIDDVIVALGGSSYQYYINGSTAAGSTTLTPGVVGVAFTAGAATTTVRIGSGVQGTNTTGAVTLRFPQFEPGSIASRIYRPNDSTTRSYEAPRFDYDPTSIGTPRGLLIEGSASNLCTYSGDMTQSGAGHWSTRTALITTLWTGFTAPDGTASAVKIIPDTTSSRHTLENASPSLTSGVVYTASAFVKADGYSVVGLVVAGGQTRRNFTLSGNGTVGSQFGLSNTANITPIGTSGWYRVEMTWTSNLTGNAGFWIGVPQNASTDVVSAWTGNGTSAIQAWGAQVEAGSGASSYIPTGARTGSRAADNCYMDGTNFSSWFTNNAEGSFLVRYSMNNPSAFLGSGIDRYAYEVSNSSGTSRVFCNASYRVSVAGDAGRFPRVFDLGTIDLAPSLVATAAQNTAFAWGYKSNDNHLAAVGVTASDTSGSLQTGLDRIHLGSNRSFGSTSYLQGCISLLKYWPTRLPNAQLQSLTT